MLTIYLLVCHEKIDNDFKWIELVLNDISCWKALKKSIKAYK